MYPSSPHNTNLGKRNYPSQAIGSTPPPSPAVKRHRTDTETSPPWYQEAQHYIKLINAPPLPPLSELFDNYDKFLKEGDAVFNCDAKSLMQEELISTPKSTPKNTSVLAQRQPSPLALPVQKSEHPLEHLAVSATYNEFSMNGYTTKPSYNPNYG